MSEYQKGFDDAIDKVIKLAETEANKYGICRSYNMTCKAESLRDFQLLLQELFQCEVIESKHE